MSTWGPVTAQMSREPIQLDMVRPGSGTLLVGLVVLAGLNAMGEELVWRRSMLEAVSIPHGPIVFVAQGLSFGMAHWQGLPGGPVGVALTAGFSVVCVWLHRLDGLRASILAHALADIVIFAGASPYLLFTGWWSA